MSSNPQDSESDKTSEAPSLKGKPPKVQDSESDKTKERLVYSKSSVLEKSDSD